jgi:hypothetical protein
VTKPDQKSWDFDESKQDFGEKRNPLKPHDKPMRLRQFRGLVLWG